MKLKFTLLFFIINISTNFCQITSHKRISLGTFTHNANLIGVFDFNQDGDKDIITSKNDSTLLFLENTGEMHFKESGVLSISSDLQKVFMYDYNQDGMIDLFLELGTYYNTRYQCFLQSSNLEFNEIDISSISGRLQLMDFDLDGKGELVSEEDNIVLKVNYNLPFDTLIDLNLWKPNILQHSKNHFIDYDLDGDMDVLCLDAHYITYNGSNLYLFRNDSGQYSIDTLFSNRQNDRIIDIHFADIDSDGDIDCFYRSNVYEISSSGSSIDHFPLRVMYFENDTIFKVKTLLSNIGGYIQPFSHKYDFKFGDLNQDSLIDVCYYAHGDRWMRLGQFLNSDTGFAYSRLDGYQTLTGNTYDYEVLTINDIDGDEINEIIFATSKIDGIYYIDNKEKKIISDNSRVNVMFYLDSNTFMINKGHFRYAPRKGYYFHLDMSGGVRIERAPEFDFKYGTDNNSYLTSSLIDVNQDQSNEIVIGDKWGDVYSILSKGSIMNWYRDSVYNSTFTKYLNLDSYNQSSVTTNLNVLDFDYDYDLDIIKVQGHSIFLHKNINYDSILPPQPLYTDPDSLIYFKVKLAQFNEDNNIDFIAERRDTALLDVLINTYGSYTKTQTLSGKLRYVQDVNNDGFDDVFTNASLYLNMQGYFEEYVYPYENEYLIHIMDENNDEILDIITIDSTYQMRIYYSTNGHFFDSVEVFDDYTDLFNGESYNKSKKTVVKDFDMNGDGHNEILVDVKDKVYSHNGINNDLYLYISDDYSSLIPPSNASDIYDGENPFIVYPNPAKHLVYIQGDINIDFIYVYDELGKLVKKMDLKGGKIFFVGDLPQGVYFLEIVSNMMSETHFFTLVKL